MHFCRQHVPQGNVMARWKCPQCSRIYPVQPKSCPSCTKPGTHTVECPDCGKECKVPAMAAGKRGRCICGNVFRIEIPSATPSCDLSENTFRPNPTEPSANPTSKTNSGISLIVICSFASIGGCFGGVVGLFAAHYFALWGGFVLMGEPGSLARWSLVPGHMALIGSIFSITGGLVGWLFTIKFRPTRMQQWTICLFAFLICGNMVAVVLRTSLFSN